ncbi:hypothetical protein BAUCODRAFT_37506 [Baudoinia panamericana UAMH 10762]|uniref:DUF1772 domain-containing protein n=1 Tax=Baudoinia panamericana (strain UAMH 10762) TaxID=717646 RepID=M2LF11_BAUPA|nr:uncharacterized protein BAUCODRAFT_37506 [Baudoinia panamericana UAMH 10762]EMC92612.1 hypothetical protein BAUCODRAFT_37506 [Baudoinia panamericana UAMH 10762]
MPMLEMEEVPSGLQGKQLRWLLHASEIFFPRLNATYTLANLVLTVTCYLNRKTSREAAMKLPYVGAATAFGVATTAYALGIMAPINTVMKKMSMNLERDQDDEKSHKELRAQQKTWKAFNIGRALCMLSCAIAGAIGLLV